MDALCQTAAAEFCGEEDAGQVSFQRLCHEGHVPRPQSGPDAPGGLLQSGGLLLSFSSSCTCGLEEPRLLPERALGGHQVRLPGRQLDLLARSLGHSRFLQTSFVHMNQPV